MRLKKIEGIEEGVKKAKCLKRQKVPTVGGSD
jgi:hypothetical protein